MNKPTRRVVSTIIRDIPQLAVHGAVLVDVGAAGGIHGRWSDLGTPTTVIGFEPDPREFSRLDQSEFQRWYNVGLYSAKETRALNITRWQTNTSLLEPDPTVIARIYQNTSDFDVIERRSIACDTLDHVLDASPVKPDVIKLDTQGSELAILSGAVSTLDQHVFAVEVEVEFVPLYKNQPLFADVDRFLRDRDFQILDCGNMLYHKWAAQTGVGGTKGQLVAADALYVKTPEAAAALVHAGGMPKLWRTVLVSLAYGYPDYARLVCESVVRAGDECASEARQIGELLRAINDRARRLPDFWGRERLFRKFSKWAERIRPVRNARWLNRLGNR